MSKSNPVPAFNAQKTTLLERTVEFINKNKRALLVVFVIIVLGSIVLFINNQNKNNDENEATRIYDIALSSIENLNYVTNAQEQNRIFWTQISNLFVIIQTYPETVSANRARMFLANNYLERTVGSSLSDADMNQVLSAAYTLYTDVVANAKTDFYRAMGTLGIAYCHEIKNDYRSAIAQYDTVIEKYSKEGFTPYAMIAKAQNLEVMNDINGALNIYRAVSENYTNSEWYKFAKAKIYYYSNPNTAAPVQNLPMPQGADGIQLLPPQ
jgi:predicted negative regulator of RcsB-dependent stress response